MKVEVLTKEMQATLVNLSDEQLQSIGLMKLYDEELPPQSTIFPEEKDACVSLCHQCSDECQDPECENLTADEVAT